MTQEEVENKLAQVMSLPLKKRALLADAHSPKYYVMMTFPYCSFVQDEEGYDFFYTFDENEAEEYCASMQEKHPICKYSVYVMSRCN